jgi:hypothetical protein
MRLRWVKVITQGRATGSDVPLAMLEEEITFSKPTFYKLQAGTPNAKGEVDWTDVEIEGPK